MTVAIPRLRVFAGPNGSGKSTLKDRLPPEWLGVYVNADEIEKTIRAKSRLPLSEFSVSCTAAELKVFLKASTLLTQQKLLADVDAITLEGDDVVIQGLTVNSYHASVLADFIRQKLLGSKTSFTFETVMSSLDKVTFICEAQSAGFRTYLYYVATEDPEINVSRVQHRVATGGHPVPIDKIISRYERSLGLLSAAVACTDRAYVFDNSSDQRVWVAEVTGGVELQMRSDSMPQWFKTALWDEFEAN